MTLRSVYLLTVFLTAVVQSERLGAQRPYELVIVSEPHVHRIALRLTRSGVSVEESHRRFFRSFVNHFDVDRDGRLSMVESSHLPTPFGVRSWASGRVVSAVASPPASADADANGFLSNAELAEYYDPLRSVCITAWGRSPAGEPLDARLTGWLEQDVGEALREKLFLLDRNGDGLVSPGELVPDCRYPGTTASSMVLPESRSPVWMIPPSSRRNMWIEALFVRLDADQDSELSPDEFTPVDKGFDALDCNHNGSVASAEFKTWFLDPPDEWIDVNVMPDATRFRRSSMPKESPSSSALSVKVSGVHHTRFHSGGSTVDATRRKVDAIADDWNQIMGGRERVSVERSDQVTNATEMVRVAMLMDVDRDGYLSREEVERWRKWMLESVVEPIVISVMDFQDNRFTQFDENHDGSLSRIEVSRLVGVSAKHPPRARQLRVCISLGRPSQLLDRGSDLANTVPAWFTPMDRNHDGVVDRDEFPGSDQQFARFDQDGDGRLRADEF